MKKIITVLDIPKTFCITLKDTPKRTQYAKNHFIENKLDFEFFYGIDGYKFGLKTKIPYNDDNPTGPDYFITSGHIGCILSHYMLWQTLMYLPYEEIVILEDDVILCENFIQKLSQCKKNLPSDWQYVFIGNCCLDSEPNHIKISENIITTNTPPLCTHAYMVKKSSLPILLETNHMAWSHIDIQIQKRSLKQLKYYIFNPPLAFQKSIDPKYSEDFQSLTRYIS